MITGHHSIENILQRIHELPALPAVVRELIQSLEDVRVSTEDLAAKLSYDQAIAAKMLRLANSSFYGLARRVTSIEESAAILGLRTLRSVAIAAGLVNQFSGVHCRGFDFSAFWKHVICTALIARELARSIGADEDAAFTLGLVHDIGRLVLVTAYSESYSQVIEYRAMHDCQIYAAERHVFGLDHADVGARLAEHWHFAPETVSAIAIHHRPPVEGHKSLVDVVHVADNIAHALDLSSSKEDMVPELSIHAWARLRLPSDCYLKIFESVEHQHDVLCRSLLS